MRLNKPRSFVILSVDSTIQTQFCHAECGCLRENHETYQFIQTCLVLSSISEIVTEMFFFAKARCETSSNRLDNRALFPPGINMRVSV